MKNKLLKGGHLSEKKCREILQLFSEDLTATQIADIIGVSRVTVNNYFKLLRTIVASYCEALHAAAQPDAVLTNIYQPDAAVAPAAYVTISVYKGQVYTGWLKSVPETSIREAVHSAAETHPLLADAYAVIDCANWKMYSIRKNDTEGTAKAAITDFWNYTKTRLQKFRGLNKNMLYLHIKECEFRYNGREGDLPAKLQQAIDWRYQRKQIIVARPSFELSGVLQ